MWHRLTMLAMAVAALYLLAACGSEPQPEESSLQILEWTYEGPTATAKPPNPESPTPEPIAEVRVEVEASGIYDDYFGAATASVEERIYLADVIVRATLVSEANGLLNFRTVEYLKGTGPATFTIAASSGRNTQWDEREAILFLDGAVTASEGRSQAPDYEFVDANTFDHIDPWGRKYVAANGVTVDSNNPVWLPSTTVSTSEERSSSASGEFITGAEAGDQGTVTLADLKAKIAWITGGEGIEGYDECIRDSLTHIRYGRDWEAYHGEAPSVYQVPSSVESGVADAEITDWRGHRSVTPGYSEVIVGGVDGALFVGRINDDDSEPANGYTMGIVSARPLPAGTYTVFAQIKSYVYVPCNFDLIYTGLEWLVNVTAPAGTVYEAFFDSTATGFTSQGGELEPATFTANGRASTVEALKYENGEVILKLNPFNALAGQHLYFIELDGSFGLVLSASSATADSTAGTLTWSVAEQPWESGDQLMLRITAAAASSPPDTPDRPTGQLTGEGSVSLDWNDVPTATSYRVRFWLVPVSGFVELSPDHSVHGISITLNGSSATVTGLSTTTHDGVYAFQIQAVNGDGESQWSPDNAIPVP